MNHSRKSERLALRLQRAGWRVRRNHRNGAWLAWPPEQHLPPVTIHSTQSCGIEDRNLLARLRHSGYKGVV